MGATSQRGRTIEEGYYRAVLATTLARNARTGTTLQTSGSRLVTTLGARSSGISRFGYVEATQSPVTAATQPKAPMSLSLSNIIGAVGNAVGNIFGGTPTATSPTPTSTLGSVTSAVGSVIGAVLPGGGAVNTVMNLPGRSGSSGISDVILERPASGSGGGGGLSRYGIPRGWSKKRVKALVRSVGVSVAASILSAPLEGVAIVATMAGSRGRGISARDLRVTKRVTRRVLGIARDLAAIRPPAARRAPSRGTRVICN